MCSIMFGSALRGRRLRGDPAYGAVSPKGRSILCHSEARASVWTQVVPHRSGALYRNSESGWSRLIHCKHVAGWSATALPGKDDCRASCGYAAFAILSRRISSCASENLLESHNLNYGRPRENVTTAMLTRLFLSYENEMALQLEISEIRLARKANGRVQHLSLGHIPWPVLT